MAAVTFLVRPGTVAFTIIECEPKISSQILSRLRHRPQLPVLHAQLPSESIPHVARIFMIRLVLIRSLRPLVSRGRTWLSDSQKVDKHRSTSQSLLVSKYSCVYRRVIRYLSCIGAIDGEIDMNLNVASERLPTNQADVWTRCHDLVSEGDVGHFVVGLLDYLRTSGGRGRANLADDLSRCVQHVRL